MAVSLQYNVMRGISKNIYGSPAFMWYQKNICRGLYGCCGLQRFSSSKANTSSPTYANPSSPSVNKENIFINIYKMPYIKHLAVIHKVKLQQTILTSVLTPVSSILAYTGHVPPGTGWAVGAIGFAICSFFYMLGFCGTNVVGYVYVTPDNSTIRISYVDNWGRRRDDDFPSEDLIPLTELPKTYLEPLYFKLQRYSQQHKGGLYKLNLSEAGQITDQDRFTNLFGKVDT